MGDNADAFPTDSQETVDTDNDGVGDNADAFPSDPTETADIDGDGVGDNVDVFPNDPSEWEDANGDGIGDNAGGVVETTGAENQALSRLRSMPRQSVFVFRAQVNTGILSGCGIPNQWALPLGEAGTEAAIILLKAAADNGRTVSVYGDGSCLLNSEGYRVTRITLP